MRKLADRIVHARKFEYVLTVLIIGSAALLGIGTSEDLLARYILLIVLIFLLTLAALILEVLLKMFALSPRIDRYFRDGWNAFDFLVIASLIISLVAFPEVGAYGLLIILVRLLRLLQGLSTVQDLRLILSTLIRSIPSAGHIVVLLGIVIYGYAIIGHRNFGEHDPEHWGNLGVSVLSMFQIMTLDDWVNVMGTAIELQPLAWVYFISFIIISAYIVTNLFIAIVIRNLDEARQERARPLETPASREELLRELRSTRQAFQRLEERLQHLPD